jgi:hypothetical protein
MRDRRGLRVLPGHQALKARKDRKDRKDRLARKDLRVQTLRLSSLSQAFLISEHIRAASWM